MKKLALIALPVIGLGIIGLIIISSHENCSADASCKPNNIATNTAQQADVLSLKSIQADLANGALLVDVRTAEEYAAEHAAGSINLSVEKITSGIYPTKNKNATIYVYCRSGKRANAALEAMNKAGYKEVASLTSLDRWKQIGGETVTP